MKKFFRFDNKTRSVCLDYAQGKTHCNIYVIYMLKHNLSHNDITAKDNACIFDSCIPYIYILFMWEI